MNPRKLNAKQACTLAFIAHNKIHIVTVITFDASSVTILINIDLLIQQAFTNLYTGLWLTLTEL